MKSVFILLISLTILLSIAEAASTAKKESTNPVSARTGRKTTHKELLRLMKDEEKDEDDVLDDEDGDDEDDEDDDNDLDDESDDDNEGGVIFPQFHELFPNPDGRPAGPNSYDAYLKHMPKAQQQGQRPAPQRQQGYSHGHPPPSPVRRNERPVQYDDDEEDAPRRPVRPRTTKTSTKKSKKSKKRRRKNRPTRPVYDYDEQPNRRQYYEGGPPPGEYHNQGPPPPGYYSESGPPQGGYEQGPSGLQFYEDTPPQGQGQYQQGPPPSQYYEDAPPQHQQGPPPQYYEDDAPPQHQQGPPEYYDDDSKDQHKKGSNFQYHGPPQKHQEQHGHSSSGGHDKIQTHYPELDVSRPGGGGTATPLVELVNPFQNFKWPSLSFGNKHYGRSDLPQLSRRLLSESDEVSSDDVDVDSSVQQEQDQPQEEEPQTPVQVQQEPSKPKVTKPTLFNRPGHGSSMRPGFGTNRYYSQDTRYFRPITNRIYSDYGFVPQGAFVMDGYRPSYRPRYDTGVEQSARHSSGQVYHPFVTVPVRGQSDAPYYVSSVPWSQSPKRVQNRHNRRNYRYHSSQRVPLARVPQLHSGYWGNPRNTYVNPWTPSRYHTNY